MGPNTFQSSFIPKSSENVVVSEDFQKKRPNFFGVLSVLFFVGVMLVTIVLFGYRWTTLKAIASLENNLILAEKNIDTESVSKMSNFSKKLSLTRQVILRHRVVSNFLLALGRQTIQSVEWNSFSYNFTPDGEIAVLLSGRARNYASIALEEEALAKLQGIKTMQFSELNLNDGGTVSFKLMVILDGALNSYLPAANQNTTNTTTVTSTANNTNVTDSDDISIGDLDVSFPDLNNI